MLITHYANAQSGDGVLGCRDELLAQFYRDVFKTLLCLIELSLHRIVLNIGLVDNTCA